VRLRKLLQKLIGQKIGHRVLPGQQLLLGPSNDNLIMLAHIYGQWKYETDNLAPNCCPDEPYYHTHQLADTPKSRPCECGGVLTFFKQIVGLRLGMYAEKHPTYRNEFVCNKCNSEWRELFVLKLEAYKQ